MHKVIQTSDITIYQGLAQEWQPREHIDLVLTNPYGYMPRSLVTHPMVIHQWTHRKAEAEIWSGNVLDHCVSKWNDGREAFWSANTPWVRLDLTTFRPEPGGWYPEDMVRQLLDAFAHPGQTVWDGFMGRGTVGKICREKGLKYVGVEELPRHIVVALEYLELKP